MNRCLFVIISMFMALSVAAQDSKSSATESVRAAEIAFAQSMADRDFARFGEFVADDAVFLNGDDPLRGKSAILSYWKQYFTDAPAPFSWKPDMAEANLLGTLGTTTGPVTSPTGKVFARFYSMWRRSASGSWQIVFDNGYPHSPAEPK